MTTAKLTPQQVDALRSVPLGDMPNKVLIARRMLGLKQVDVAAAIGRLPPNLSDIERGDYKDLPLETARLLSDFFGAPIEVLFPAREAVTP